MLFIRGGIRSEVIAKWEFCNLLNTTSEVCLVPLAPRDNRASSVQLAKQSKTRHHGLWPSSSMD
ncbi:hypothetical protein T4D_17016 [Trichinella pseudospiralis]|uniref:Uncharacterized protein n=1 Tax=Trichinella pseudospiralis TaxID=6337 RepID=A0A0V1F2Z5_TRIPS|nr:hypothetical protein T4D_17016 [Trichinella pseudospiralis]